MLTRYYKIYGSLLVIGCILMILSYVADLSFVMLKMNLILKVLAGVLFIISMIYYYKIMTILVEVTDLTLPLMWTAIIAHVSTLAAIYVWDDRVVFSILFFGSIVARKMTGIMEFDREMKSLCGQLDVEMLKLAEKEMLAELEDDDEE